MTAEFLIEARWLIPIEPEKQTLENHSLVIGQGKIIDLLPKDAARARYPNITVIERPHHVLLPGLVNSHTHAAMNLLRGIADDLPLMDWLEKHIWPLEQQWVGAEFVRVGGELAMAEMLKSGTTCFNDMYLFPETLAQAASKHGIRAAIGLIVIDFPTAWAPTANEYLEKGLALYDRLHHEPLLSWLFAPHAPYTVSDAPLSRLKTLADQLELKIHMHVHETLGEVEQAVAQTGRRPLARLHELGLVDDSLIAVHMTQLTDDEIEQLARAGTSIVHCPESNLKLASGFAPIARCLDAGINVALGTDGAASNNDLNMLGEMRTAALVAKAVAGDATALPAHQALRMATLNGAKALGLDEQIGSLVPGKAADMIAIDLNDLETQPLYCPASQLVYSASRDQVSDVWVAGKALLKDKRLTTFDLGALSAEVKAWRDKLKA
ncbi:MAG: TRZ/ATZ family hydrolase [Methylococcales bacterium]|nr:TRZ/ATZ family hydrolase [Methylococcales bacterium]